MSKQKKNWGPGDPRLRIPVQLVEAAIKEQPEIRQSQLFMRLLDHAESMGARQTFADCAIENFALTCAEALVLVLAEQAVRESMARGQEPDDRYITGTILLCAGCYITDPASLPLTVKAT